MGPVGDFLDIYPLKTYQAGFSPEFHLEILCEPRKKKTGLAFHESGLFNGDPYNGLCTNPHITE